MKEILRFADKWQKYLPPNDHGTPAPWNRIYNSTLTDVDWVEWSYTEKGVWIELLLLRGRNGQELENDIPKLWRQLGLTSGPDKRYLQRCVKNRIEDGSFVVQKIEDETQDESETESNGTQDESEQDSNRTQDESETKSNGSQDEREQDLKEAEVQQNQQKESKITGKAPESSQENPSLDLRLKTKDLKDRIKGPQSEDESESGSQEKPKLIPIQYLSPNSAMRNSEAEKLVGQFLSYLNNEGFNEKHNLLDWHNKFLSLLKQYKTTDLSEVLKYTFEEDGYWLPFFLKVQKVSKIQYLEQKLPQLIDNFNSKKAEKVKKQKQSKVTTGSTQPEPSSSVPPDYVNTITKFRAIYAGSRHNNGKELREIFVKFFDYYRNDKHWEDEKNFLIQLGLINEKGEYQRGEEEQ